jgi:hypothetical protein
MNERRGPFALSVGMAVKSNDGMIGVVIPAGPYGDSPFQVESDIGEVFSFVEAEGTCAYNIRQWNAS